MSLFSTEDLTKKKPDRPQSGSVPFTGSNLLTIGKANEKLRKGLVNYTSKPFA